MDDHEIQSTVESILGPGVKVIDCEKKSCVQEEEVLLINGVPITLEGPDGVAIREAMITGQVPPCDLLNRILIRAGIQRYRRVLRATHFVPHYFTNNVIPSAKNCKLISKTS